MSIKHIVTNKICMCIYDNIKLQKKTRHICSAIKDIEKTLCGIDKKSSRKSK